MIDLILTVCLLSAPAACREEWPQAAGESLTGCLTQGQFRAVEWALQHPGYRVAEWRCQPRAARKTPI
ncbi:hypothetical protein [Teichococcus oryzae]|jgi:hypothetical protein|uniref:Uncharacterized protein n=1 Tax=Teichococcus oryzae TaxID=1608942 RepID=A0A5B2THU3_9PROT|nr:hypothetical protein [Pseudoroseomonas oryzae]KAA2213508.1 hypothetical protein F0Q34_09750 [Pseudoroseomonas oryzae]